MSAIEAEIDRAILLQRELKVALDRLADQANEFGKTLTDVSIVIRQNCAIQFYQRDRELMREWQRMSDQIERLRELKNMMDFGTLVVSSGRTLEQAWEKIP
jgi:galactokinase